ncbi:SRCR domain, partial [Trinorchestia longiramus]
MPYKNPPLSKKVMRRESPLQLLPRGAQVLLLLLGVMRCCLTQDARCTTPFGSFPDASHCDRYVACWNGRGFLQRCSDSMVFNPVTKRCQLGLECPGLRSGAPPSGELVRLVQGLGPRDGRLTVLHNGHWSYVRATGLSTAAARLVCRHLGHPNAESSSLVVPLTRGSMPMVDMTCPDGAQNIVQCKPQSCSDCPPDSPIATIRCMKESSSRCPDRGGGRWEAWQGSCYLVGVKTVHRGGAAAACRSLEANLVDVQSKAEHQWLSALVSAQPNSSIYYTAGQLESDLQWRWREYRTPVTYARWWHGWNSTVDSTRAPTASSAATCLVLRRSFPTTTTPVSAGFYFFSPEDCLAARGFICKAPKKDVGCRQGSGVDYAGVASLSISGRACVRWDDRRLNSVREGGRSGRSRVPFDVSLLGAHNFCRNPDASPAPWCYVAPDVIEPCDVPLCTTQNLITQSSVSPAQGRSTTGSLLRPFRPTRSPRGTTRSPATSNTSILPSILAMMATTRRNRNVSDRTTTTNNNNIRKASPPLIISSGSSPSVKIRCPAPQRQCLDEDKCVSAAELCDGVRHCQKGDDERNCARFLAEFEQFQGRTLLLQTPTEDIRGQDVAVCAKLCIDRQHCRGLIHDAASKKCRLTRIGVASGALQQSATESFYELKSRRSSCTGRLQ